MVFRRSRPERATRPKRHLALRLLLIVIVVLWAAAVLPAPWAYHIGGRFSLAGEWDGYGPVRASDGGRYLLFTHLRGGIINNHGTPGCGLLSGCGVLSGSAQLCTEGGQHYTFALTGTMHGWYTTNGSHTVIELTGGTPRALPKGTAVAFHGVWQGPVLPVASTHGSFTGAITPAGTIQPAGAGAARPASPAARSGTARGELRAGSQASFGRACALLAHPGL